MTRILLASAYTLGWASITLRSLARRCLRAANRRSVPSFVPTSWTVETARYYRDR